MKAVFVKALDEALGKAGYSTRADFMRDAAYEKLEKLGFKIPREWSAPPSRIGKGGRPSHSKKLYCKRKKTGPEITDEGPAAEKVSFFKVRNESRLNEDAENYNKKK